MTIANPVPANATTSLLDEKAAAEVYQQSLVIDGLSGELVLSSLIQLRAGFTALNVTVTPQHSDYLTTLKSIYKLYTYMDAAPDKLLHVLTSSDIGLAKETGRLGIIFGLQDGSSLGTELPRLTILHRLGLRIMTLTYNERNALGDGCMEPHDHGITNFGMQVVRELNRLGIVLDLSHVSRQTSLDALKIAERPPVFSHSNAYALTPSPRCITDEQIRAAVELGGVIGITAYSPMAYQDPEAQPTVEDLLNHVDYVVEKFGIDHVGIGTDIWEGYDPTMWRATTKRRYPEMVGTYEYSSLYTKGFENHLEMTNVVNGLANRGYDAEAIRKVIGGNFMRVFEQNF